MDCLFCGISSGEIPSVKVYEDESILAFEDVKPVAPVHILVIPKEHITSAADITPSNSLVIARIFEVIAEIAKDKGLEDGGFRVITNAGEDGGQTVFHLHFHLIGGRKLGARLC
jgi:histidine triad (HIT) family protein